MKAESLRNEPNVSPAVRGRETAQAKVWKGDFGREYTDRNTMDVASLDALYLSRYGITRTEMNEMFLPDIPKDAAFLEVGCNSGNQLLLLQQMGYSSLSGIELQPYALEIARRRLRDISLKEGSVLEIPYEDAAFDLVFTAGVLIHIAPQNLLRAMSEVYRCSRAYIWGLEYYARDATEVNYRGQANLLWKMDYARHYLDLFPDLELVREKRFAYVDGPNVDAGFLLRKKR
jgi:pseudaminic acid biosynthesis-associated methylase